MAALPDSESKLDMLHCTVVLQAMCGISIIVLIKAAGFVEVAHHDNAVKIYDCVTAKGIMNVCPRRTFYIAIPNFGRLDVDFSMFQKVGEGPNAPTKIVHIAYKTH